MSQTRQRRDEVASQTDPRHAVQQERSTRRALRPRATDGIAVTPVLVSDRTCAALVGLEPRAFRAFVLDHHIQHQRAGKRLIVRAKDLEDAIAQRDDGPVDARAIADPEPTRSEILARVAGGRR